MNSPRICSAAALCCHALLVSLLGACGEDRTLSGTTDDATTSTGDTTGATTASSETPTTGGAESAFWSRRFGAAGLDEGRAIAVSPAGTIAVSGLFHDTIDFGVGPLVSPSEAPFLAALDPLGEPLWSRAILASDYAHWPAVAFDGEALVIAGELRGTVDLGTGMLDGGPEGSTLVAKLDATGATLWARTLDAHFGGFAVGPGGIIALAVYVDIPVAERALITLDGTGEMMAARSLPVDVVGDMGVGFDGAGNIVLAGVALGPTVDLGLGPVATAGNGDLFVARFDASLAPLSSRVYGTPEFERFSGSAVDADGAVVLSGFSYGDIDFGAGPLGGLGAGSPFLVKLDAEYNVVWARTDVETSEVVALDATGRTVVQSFNTFATIDAVGDIIGTHSLGGFFVSATAVTANGDIVLTGALFSPADFGLGALVPEGKSDVVVAKLPFD